MIQRLFKQNSLFVATIIGGAFLLEVTGNGIVDSFYDTYNKGKLWKDLEKKLQAQE